MSNTAYTIYRDDGYTVTATPDEDGNLHFNVTDYPDKQWVWCDVRDSGVVNIHHALGGNTVPFPHEFSNELEEATWEQARLEDAVDEARQMHELSQPATLTITMDQRGAAFTENPDETARILRNLADSWGAGSTPTHVMDVNGNTVGSITQTYESGLDRDLA